MMSRIKHARKSQGFVMSSNRCEHRDRNQEGMKLMEKEMKSCKVGEKTGRKIVTWVSFLLNTKGNE